MAGEIDRQHREPMVGEIARLQRPHRMIILRSMNEHGRWQVGIEALAAGIRIGRLRFEIDDHRSGSFLRCLQAAFEIIDQVIRIFKAD